MAAAAGSAGASEATSARPDSALLNPAGLLPGEEAWLGLGSGLGDAQNKGLGEAYMVYPLADDLTAGLAWNSAWGGLGPGFFEQSLGLSGGLAVSPGLTLGLRGLWHNARDLNGQAKTVQGFSADAGLRYELPLFQKQHLTLGWWGTQLASEWSDPKWRRTVPQTHRFGLSWAFRRLGSLDLGLELSQGAAIGQEGQNVQVGLESLLWKKTQARLGASFHADGLHYAAGASHKWSYRKLKSVVHAAIIRRPNEWLARFQLDVGLSVRRQSTVLAVPINVTYAPGSKKVQSATLDLKSFQTKNDVQDWTLEIRDKDGRVIRVLKGTGLPPALVTWDGRDALGEAVEDADGITYKLNLKSPGDLQALAVDLSTASISDGGLSSLDAQNTGPEAGENALEQRLLLRQESFRPGGPSLNLRLSDSSLDALEEIEPTPVATQAPTLIPTLVPTVRPTPEPTAVPTVQATPLPTALPTEAPTVLSTPLVPKAEEAKATAQVLAAGLAAPDLAAAPALPPAFMTRAQAEGQSNLPTKRGKGRRRLSRPSPVGVLDIFQPNSAELAEPNATDRLQAFYWRLQGMNKRRIQLTGLVGLGENGGEALSRSRCRVLSRLMVEEGGFEGEFILRVDGKTQAEKGVRVEVLDR